MSVHSNEERMPVHSNEKRIRSASTGISPWMLHALAAVIVLLIIIIALS